MRVFILTSEGFAGRAITSQNNQPSASERDNKIIRHFHRRFCEVISVASALEERANSDMNHKLCYLPIWNVPVHRRPSSIDAT